MNKHIDAFCRNWLKEHLAQLTPKNHDLFRRMYGHKLPEDVSYIDVVDQMDPDKFETAMRQVEQTIIKINTETTE